VYLRSWKVIHGRPAFFRRGANERLRRFEWLIGVPHMVAKKVAILVGRASLQFLLGLPRPMALEGVPGPGVRRTVRPLFFVLESPSAIPLPSSVRVSVRRTRTAPDSVSGSSKLTSPHRRARSSPHLMPV
jgi:hypothetical protein